MIKIYTNIRAAHQYAKKSVSHPRPIDFQDFEIFLLFSYLNHWNYCDENKC